MRTRRSCLECASRMVLLIFSLALFFLQDALESRDRADAALLSRVREQNGVLDLSMCFVQDALESRDRAEAALLSRVREQNGSTPATEATAPTPTAPDEVWLRCWRSLATKGVERKHATVGV